MSEMETIYLFVIFLMGFMFVIAGYIMYKYPYKKINHIYGYRTPRSKSNQSRWDLSQKYSGKLMVYFGILGLAIGLIIWFLFEITVVEFLVVIAIQCLFVIPLFFLVEGKIKDLPN